MGLYNTLKHEFTCPRCGESSVIELEIKGGYAQFIEYKIGDIYQWRPRKAVQNGGRPTDGTAALEAYAFCERCDKDFFTKVLIVKDTIVGVEIDPGKPGYTP